MSDEIYFDGIRYLSAAEAADFCGFTRDYVAKLCRDGKVYGRRVGKNWYVNDSSLKNFLLEQQYTKTRTRESLAEERSRAYRDSQSVVPSTERFVQASHIVRNATAAMATGVAVAKDKIITGAAKHSARMSETAREMSTTVGVSDAAIRAVHIPAYTITPWMELVHKALALTMAVTLTFGIYASIDPQYARFAVDSTIESAKDVANKTSALAHGGALHAAATLALRVGTSAQHPGAMTASAASMVPAFAAVARTVNAAVNDAVYAIAFPPSLTQGGVSGSVAVEIEPYAATHIAALEQPATTPTSSTAAASVAPRVIERIVTVQSAAPAVIAAAGGISEDFLNEKLNELDNKLSQRMYSLSSANSTVISQNYNVTAQTNRIDKLGNVSITNSTFADGTISNTDVNARSLSVAGNTTLTGATVNGDITLTGSLTMTSTSSSSGLNATNATLTNLTATNATSTNLYADVASSTSLFATEAQLGVLAVGTLNVSGLGTFATGFISQASSTIASDFTVSGTTTLSTLVAGSATSTNFFASIASSTSLFAQSAALGDLTANTGVFGAATSTNFNATNATTTNLFTQTLSVGSLNLGNGVTSSIVPAANKTYDLGSPSFFWRNGYIDTITVNNISAASTSIGGTASNSFTLNSDNATADTEDMSLIFFRGVVVPNGVISWNSAANAKRFEFNQSTYIANQSGSTTQPTLTLKGAAGQTGNIFQIASSSGATVFAVASDGGVTISTSTILALASGTSSITNLAVTNTNDSSFAGGLVVGGNATTSGQSYFGGRVGIGTSTPASSLDIFATDALHLPVGTTGQRPAMNLVGQVRYNTTTHQFEGYGDSSAWQGLGGVIDTDQDTYISADTNNTNENYLRFFTTGVQRLTITNTGSVGIGTTTPGAGLSIVGKGLEYSTSTNPNTSTMALFINPAGTSAGIGIGSFNGLGTHYATIQGGGTSGGTAVMLLNPAGRNVGIGAYPTGAGAVALNTSNALNISGGTAIGNDYWGTTAPANGLLVQGSVGIGTSTPQSLLSIAGTSGTSFNSTLRITDTSTASRSGIGFFYGGTQNYTNAFTTSAGDNINGDAIAANYAGGIIPKGTSAGSVTGGVYLIGNSNASGVSAVTVEANQGVEGATGAAFEINAATQSAGARASLADTSGLFQLTNNGTTKFKILGNGNVGIGTATPASTNGFNKSLVIQGTGSASTILTDGTNSFELGLDSAHRLRIIGSAAGSAFTVDTTGNVGIGGVTTPLAKLLVKGAGSGTGVNFQTTNSANTPLFSILDNGAVGIGTTSPFRKLSVTDTSNQLALAYDASNYSDIGTNASGFLTLAPSGGRVSFGTGTYYLSTGNGGSNIYTLNFNRSLGVNYATPDITGTTGLVIAGTGAGVGTVAINTSGSATTPTAFFSGTNVGIGTTTMTQLLNVAGNISLATGGTIFGDGNRGSLTLNAASGASFAYSGGSNGTNQLAIGNGIMSFTTNSLERARIDVNGNFGIGTTSPTNKLEVAGNTFLGGNLTITGNTTLANATSTSFFATTASSTNLFAQTASFGNVGIGTASPQYALDIQGVADGTSGFGPQLALTDTESAGAGHGPSILFVAPVSGLTKTSGRLYSSFTNNSYIGSQMVFQSMIGDNQFINDFTAQSLNVNGTLGGALGVNIPVDVGSHTVASWMEVDGSQAAGDISVEPILTLARPLHPGSSYPQVAQFSIGGYTDVGKALPKTRLDISLKDGGGDTIVGDTTVMTLQSNGNVGVGTTNPGSKLEVQGTASAQNFNATSTTQSTFAGDAIFGTASGNARSTTISGLGTLRIKGGGGGWGDSYGFTGSAGTDLGGYQMIGSADTSSRFAIGNATEFLSILTSNGSVGIGTTNPGSKLEVQGTATAQNFSATSTTATSTFSGGLAVGGSSGFNAFANGYTSIGAASDGATLFEISATGGNFAQFTRAGTGAMQLGYTGGLGAPGQTDSGTFQFTATGAVSKQGFVFQTRDSSNTLITPFYINNGGNIGIGTTTPTGNLVVNGTTGQNLLQIATSTNQGVVVVSQNGYLGVGTTSPGYKLAVTSGANNLFSVGNANGFAAFGGEPNLNQRLTVYQGDANGSNLALANTRSGGSTWIAGVGDSGSSAAITNPGAFFLYNSGTKFTVLTNGNVGIGSTTPSSKLTVYNGASGGTPHTSALLTVENSARATIQLLAPNANDSYIMFGSPAGANRAFVGYQNSAFSGGTPDQMVFQTAGSYSFGGGNVGIGTTSPTNTLEVNGGTFLGGNATTTGSAYFGGALVDIRGNNTEFRVANASLGTTFFDVNNGNDNVGVGMSAGGSGSPHIIRFGNSNQGGEYARFVSGGNFGLGTTSPTNKLEVAGNTFLGGNLTATGTLAVAGGSTLTGVVRADAGIGIGLNPLENDLTLYTSSYNGAFGTRIYNANTAGNTAAAFLGLNNSNYNAGFTLYGSGVATSSYVQPNSLTINNDSSAGINLAATNANGGITFWTGGSNQRMTINKSGNVGIGTSTPGSLFSVQGAVDATIANIQGSSNTNFAAVIGNGGGTGKGLQVNTGSGTNSLATILSANNGTGTNFFTVTNGNSYFQNGNVGIGTTTPIASLQVGSASVTLTGLGETPTLLTGGSGLWVVPTNSGRGLRVATTDYNNGSTGSELQLGLGATTGNTYTYMQQLNGGASAVGNIALNPIGGNVGIGTTTPQTNLEVAGAVAGTLRLSASNGSGYYTDIINNYDSQNPFQINVHNYGTPFGIKNVSSSFTSSVPYIDGAYGIGFAVGTSLDPTTSLKMVIGGTGNVGIGTTTPAYKLVVGGNGNGSIGIGDVFGAGNYAGITLNGTQTAGNNYNFMSGTNDPTLYINRPTGLGIRFRENNTDQMIIASGGNVGIGTTTPASKLTVQGGAWIGGTTASVDFSDNGAGELMRFTGAGPHGIYTSSYNSQLKIDGSTLALNSGSGGNVGIGTTSPSSLLSVAGNSYFTGQISVGSNANLTVPGAGTIRAVGSAAVSVNAGIWAIGLSGGQGSVGVYDQTSGHVGGYLGSGNGALQINTIDNAGAYTGTPVSITPTSVGIGTTTPGGTLAVSSTDSSALTSLGYFTSAANPSGTSYTRLRIEKGAGYGGDINGFLQQGVGSGLTFNTLNGGVSSELMRLTSAGNIGIGTTGPQGKFDVQAATNKHIGLRAASDIGGLSTGMLLEAFNDNAAATIPLQIDGSLIALNSLSGGSVGIGTSTPAGKFNVYGGTTYLDNDAASGDQLYIRGSSNMNNELVIGYNTTGNYGNITAVTQGVGFRPLALNGSGGNVGIGTTNPGAVFQVNGTRNAPASGSLNGIVRITNTADTGIAEMGISSSGAGFWIQSRDSNTGSPQNYPLLLNPLGGNVGIGTTNPGSKLAIATSTNLGTISLEFDGTSQFAGGFNNSNNGAASQTTFNFLRNNTSVGTINTTNVATAYNTTSDRRAKQDIATTTLGLDTLMQLPVRDFSFIKDPSHATTTGFIAQELYQIFPAAVTTNGDNGQVALGATSTPWSVDYGRLTPLLAKSIQDLNLKVNSITSGLNASGAGDIAPLSATTSAAELTSGVASSTAPWIASFADSSTALKQGIAAIASTVVHVLTKAVYATSGIFEHLFAKDVHTDKLCVSKSDGTEECVTGDQLAAAMAIVNNPPSNGGGSGSGSQGSGGSSDGDASSTPDTIAPTMSVIGANPATLHIGDTYADLGVTVTDNVDQNLGISATVDGGATTTVDHITIDTSVAGTHTISYSASDQAGNTGTASRTVNVIDPNAAPTTPPTDDASATSTTP